MLPSLGFQELLLLGVLALVVVGPKDLPLMLRKLGRWTARLRAMAQEFRSGMDELARQAELDELKKEVQALRADRTFSDLHTEMSRPLPSIAPPETALLNSPEPLETLQPPTEAEPETQPEPVRTASAP
jgi:sec-independent protein translocase protein TatB